MNEAPAVVRPTVRPRPTKQPEIGVTRTPATRAADQRGAAASADPGSRVSGSAVVSAVVEQQDVAVERVLVRVGDRLVSC